MPKSKNVDTGEAMPGSITELQPIVEEFVNELKRVKNEQELLREQEKELLEKFSDRLPMKTLKAAMKVVAVKEKVDKKDTFDMLVEVLERL